MKKTSTLGILIVFLSILFFADCTKKDGENCTALKNEYSRASGSFNLNPNPATCTSFKAAVISYQNSNCPTTVERQQL